MTKSNLDILADNRDFRRNIIEFIEFANSKGIFLFKADDISSSISEDDVIFEMLGIDKVELEKERQNLLNSFIQEV